MRKQFTFFAMFLLVLAGSQLFGQELHQDDADLHFGNERFQGLSSPVFARGLVACNQDTAIYPLAKTSNLQSYSLNSVSSAQRAAQYFDAPGDITISGVTFYGYSNSLPNVIVTLAIYAAGADSIPTGPPLASANYLLDTAFGNGSLSSLVRHATFANPVTTNQPYCVVFENLSSNNVKVILNDYNVPDGANEWLVSVDVFGIWTRSYNQPIGGTPMNSDFLFHPHVSYDVAANMNVDACYDLNVQHDFTNASSPVMGNRMYSSAAFMGIEAMQYTWSFGDGSPAVNAIDTFHTYTVAGTYTASLIDTMMGWSTICVSDTSISLSEGSLPVADWSSTESGLTVDFTDASTGGITSWLWDFGDGNTDTVPSPTHTYGSSGTFPVCLFVTNACGTDTFCILGGVVVVGLEDRLDQAIVIYPNPASEQLFVEISLPYQEELNLRVYSLMGNLVKEIKFGEVSQRKVEVDLGTLPNGTYLLEAATRESRYVQRLNVIR